jgi:hypothetical protein
VKRPERYSLNGLRVTPGGKVERTNMGEVVKEYLRRDRPAFAIPNAAASKVKSYEGALKVRDRLQGKEPPMADLLARLAQRPRTRPTLLQLSAQYAAEKAQAEFDRDLLLDALTAAVHYYTGSGTETEDDMNSEWYENARTILAALRGSET